jgi:hypothetical protein
MKKCVDNQRESDIIITAQNDYRKENTMVNLSVRERLTEGALVFDNPAYDNSIIGTTFDGRAIYDIEKMADELSTDDDISLEEAMDFIDYNAIRSLPYAGDKAPVVVYVEQ